MSRPLATGLPAAVTAAAIALFVALLTPIASLAASAELNTHGTRGYAIAIEAEDGKVTLSADGPAGRAVYTVPGRATRRGLAARFGRFGRVDVRFRPGSHVKLETPPRRCEGKPRVQRWGAFVGTIRFRGERRFTSVRVRRATGSLKLHPRWRCRRRRLPASPPWRRLRKGDEGLGAVSLDLVDRRHRLKGGAVTLGRGSDFSLTLFAVSMQERRGRMRIRRSTLEFGDPKDFTYDAALGRATLSPPFPFTGKGTFRRRPTGGGSWTGSLAVRLPGTGRISLVAPRFRARLHRS